MTPEQRLDRIERSLDVLASNQVAERESRLQLHEDLEILYQIVQRTDSSVNLLAERLDYLANQVDSLRQSVAQSVQASDADRAIMRDNQTEIRRIWEYLLSQQSNGHGRRE